MSDIVSYDELQRLGVLDDLATRLGMFSVAFIRLSDEPGQQDAFLGGSGTLVRVGNKLGVLTADHVLTALPKEEVGLAFPPLGADTPQRIVVRTDPNLRLRIGPASGTQSGPDIGVLLLRPADAAKIPSSSVGYNLSLRQRKVLAAPRDIGAGGWFLCGVPDEWKQLSAPTGTFTKVRLFRGFCGAGVVSRERIDSAFDYLDLDITASGAYEGPESFQGVSGGGLWQIVLEEHEGKIAISEHILSGVAFYQLVDSERVQTVVCHGRRSIYSSVLNGIAATDA